jgi:hypothetical protein
MNTLKRYLGIVSILTILALLIGSASAAGTTGTSVRSSDVFTTGNGYHGHSGNATQQQQMLQLSVTNLGQQGIDVSQPQADITSGNIPAAMQWLKSYFQAHPDQLKKEPRQQMGNTTHPQRTAGFALHNQTSQGQGPAGHSWTQNRTQNSGSPQ